MNQKIVGIIPLIAAMMFVAVFAVGDNQVAAVDQVATVTVNNNIGLTVDNTNIAYSGNDGSYAVSDSYNLINSGNVPIDVYAKLNNAKFTGGVDPTDIDTTTDPTTFQIQGQSGMIDVGYVTSGSGAILTDEGKLTTNYHADYTLPTQQQLKIPDGTQPGTYQNTIIYTAKA